MNEKLNSQSKIVGHQHYVCPITSPFAIKSYLQVIELSIVNG